MEVSGQLHALAALPPRETAPDTHWIGGWVGPRAVLDVVVKRKIPRFIYYKPFLKKSDKLQANGPNNTITNVTEIC
jgi:hypothetical protein